MCAVDICDRQTDRQTDRQIDRQTSIHAYMQVRVFMHMRMQMCIDTYALQSMTVSACMCSNIKGACIIHRKSVGLPALQCVCVSHVSNSASVCLHVSMHLAGCKCVVVDADMHVCM